MPSKEGVDSSVDLFFSSIWEMVSLKCLVIWSVSSFSSSPGRSSFILSSNWLRIVGVTWKKTEY